jgi:hypothetical protein
VQVRSEMGRIMGTFVGAVCEKWRMVSEEFLSDKSVLMRCLKNEL